MFTSDTFAGLSDSDPGGAAATRGAVDAEDDFVVIPAGYRKRFRQGRRAPPGQLVPFTRADPRRHTGISPDVLQSAVACPRTCS